MIRFAIILAIIVLVELYFLQAVKTIVQDYSPGKKATLMWIAWILAGLSVTVGVVALLYPPPAWNAFFRIVMAIMMMLILCKLLGCIVLLLDDIIRFFRWVFSYMRPSEVKAAAVQESAHAISRLRFMSQIAMAFTIIPAITLIYGVVRGAYRYKIHTARVDSPNLPDAFDGLKIVQISDVHTGSFFTQDPLRKAFQIVLDQKPDIIFFTGDLVNNEAKETDGYLPIYQMLKAPMGVYSILGNHDYGDYVNWESAAVKEENLNTLKKVHAAAGWRLLLNEHVALEKDGQKIALLGVENWGGNLHFKKYGRLNEAHAGTEQYPYKILLSHDPSHWDQQVTTAPYKDIDLTLSGHTHGMQFGIEIPGWKWSPAKYLYKHWAGLYRQDQQYLYVNRGLGFLGYPGRVGIWPEITVIELHKA